MVGAAGALTAGAIIAALATAAGAESFRIVGACRAGLPNGAYELHMPDGRLRVAGAFAHGRKTGTFIFWNATGARVAVIPYDEDAMSGTVALWYAAPGGRVESGRRLEAPYVDDRLHGVERSWHPNGAPRAEYRYEQGDLVEARAWSETGAALSEAGARNLARYDSDANRQLYAALLETVRDNLPECE